MSPPVGIRSELDYQIEARRESIEYSRRAAGPAPRVWRAIAALVWVGVLVGWIS